MDINPGVTHEHPEPDQSPRPENTEALSLTTTIAHQTRVLHKLVDAIALEPSETPFFRKVKEFYKLNPPTFDHADNLIEADDWLHGIRRRLELVKSNDKEGVNIATF